jgi:hypothetical protein
MTSIALATQPFAAPLPRAGELLARMRAAEPRFFDLGVILAIAIVPTALAMAIDARALGGASVWLKPLKFEISLTVYLLTLSLFALLLPERVRAARWYRAYSTLVVLAVVGEMAWLFGAALLGTTSHFNPTPLGTAIYQSMGALAVLLTSATAVYAWQIGRAGAVILPAPVHRAVVLGLGLTLPLTLLTAGTMSGFGGSYVGEAAEPVRLAVLGWARDGGDLRVAHFFATHAMHIVPLSALLVAHVQGASGRRVADLIAVAYAAFVIWTFAEALAGRPFLPWL